MVLPASAESPWLLDRTEGISSPARTRGAAAKRDAVCIVPPSTIALDLASGLTHADRGPAIAVLDAAGQPEFVLLESDCHGAAVHHSGLYAGVGADGG